MARKSNIAASNVTPLPGRKVADTTATIANERVQKSLDARKAYEKTGGTDVWIVDGQKAEDSRSIEKRVPDLDKKTVAIEYTVTCQKLRELLKAGGTARVHKRQCILDFSNVNGLQAWFDIALSNGVIVKLQSVVRTCIDNLDQQFYPHKVFGDFARVDVAELMAEQKRGGGAREINPVTEMEALISRLGAIGHKLSKKELDGMRAAARDKANAMAAAKPATPLAPNKPVAAKRKAS